jgi:hypothetical protein
MTGAEREAADSRRISDLFLAKSVLKKATGAGFLTYGW